MSEHEKSDPKINLTPRTIIQLLVFVIIMPLLPLLISQLWEWWEAWVYALVSILGFVISRGLVARLHPDLIVERSRYAEQEDAKSWDKILSPIVALGGIVVLITAGLDARFNASPGFALSLKIFALIIILASYALGTYALLTNRFFSGVVRIQTERGHQVVSTGPYRWVRHPGYLGAILTYFATPFFLDSIWAALPAAVIIVITVIRTHLEDKTLQDELPGYRAYAQRVRFRLLPGVW